MKECIVLAGGLGTRLQSVVKDVPKCMADISGKPFLYYLLKYLEKEQFEHIVLSLGYKHEIVTDWISKNEFTFPISYIIEEKPLGTGGAIRFAQTKINSPHFFIINGDTFFDVDTNAIVLFHQREKSDISIALKPMTNFDRYGSVTLKENKIISFNEKQFCESGLINGGIYLINKNIFSDLSLPEVFSFEKEILEKKITELYINGMIQNKYFIDIGIPEDYIKANNDFPTLNL